MSKTDFEKREAELLNQLLSEMTYNFLALVNRVERLEKKQAKCVRRSKK